MYTAFSILSFDSKYRSLNKRTTRSHNVNNILISRRYKHRLHPASIRSRCDRCIH
nr:MAG TPA_asm: hypothetical protein [Caudoviricetes sp.]